MKRPHGVSSRLRALDAILRSERTKSLIETLAIQRMMNDLEHGHERGLVWDEDAAARAVGFFDLLKHWKGEFAGRKLELAPWQEQCTIAPIFGWKRADGTRRFRLAYKEVPRKNGKSTESAGVALKGLIADDEPGAEVYTAATKRDQAAIVFGDAKNVLGPEVKPHTKQFRNSITCPRWNSSLQPLASDYNSLDGLNLHMGIVDELHAHKTRDLWDVLLTAMGARRQPLLWAITTAGFDRSSICWELREYSRMILEGHLDDDSFYTFISTCDEQDDWNDPKVWWKANPNLGISLKQDYLADLCRTASQSPAAENNFRRKHLNQWTEQDVRWLPMSLWDASNGTFREEDLIGRECFAGLDLASTRDLASLVLVFPLEAGLAVLPYFWCPKSVQNAAQKEDRSGYSGWIGKHIVGTEGNSTDQSAIRQALWESTKKFNVRALGFDPWNCTEFYQQLIREGWENEKETLLSMPQTGRTYNEPMKKLIEMLKDRRILHGGHPVLRWNAANVVAKEYSDGNIKPDKSKSGSKIDGFCAFMMAMALYLQSKAEDTSVYQTQGLFVL